MKASSHHYLIKFRVIGLILICCFFFGNTGFSQFRVLQPNGKYLTVFSPETVRQSCVFYENPPLAWFIWIDGEHRGTIPGGSTHVNIELRRGEYGKTLSIQGGVFGKDCVTRSQIVLRNEILGEVTIPYHESFAGNTSITANNLPEQACDFRIASWEGVPSSNQVQSYLYNSPATSFAVPKSNTTYTFSFNTGNRNFSKIRYYTGAVGKAEGSVQTFNNPSSSINFNYRPNSVYLNQNSNYTRLLILECYNSSNQIAQLVAMPIIVTGTQTAFTKDANGNYLTTKGPPTPSMVLHNTPGDNSFSYIAESTSTCSEVSMGFANGNNQAADVTVTVGTDVSVFGVNVESEFSITGSYSRSVNKGRESSTEVCRTITKTVENQNSFVGEDGDLFIGNYTTYRYGPSLKISYDGNCRVTASSKSLNLVAVEMEDFAYVKADIEYDIIPRVTQQRDGYSRNSIEWRDLDRNIRAWKSMMEQNSRNIASAPAFSGTKIFKGDRGALGAEESVERTQSYAMSSTLNIDASLLVEAGVNIGGSGVSGSTEVGISTEVSRGSSSSQTNSQAIGYSLQDDDEDDEFRLKVKKDLKFGTHIFELQNGSRSSCPFEQGC